MTLKQKLFVKKYIEKNGNAKEAVLDVYDTKNNHVAESIGSENLRKPEIKREIEQALERVGLNDECIADLLKESTVSGLGSKATNADSLRGIDMILKLKGAYPNSTQKTAHLRIELKEKLEDKSYSEISKELEELNKKTQELLIDAS